MTAFILTMAVLASPPPDTRPTLTLRIHVGAGRESDIIRGELKRSHPWFAERRSKIEANYRIELVEDLYRSRPVWQIGKADARHEFRAGTFAGSGTFMLSILSIAEQDQFDRHEPLISGGWAEEAELTYWQKKAWDEIQSRRPLPFPPYPDEEPPR